MFLLSPYLASRPAKVGALSLSLSLGVSLALAACSATPDEVRWFVRFAGGTAPAGTASVHTEVRTGGCGGPARFADEIAAAEGVGTSPGALPAGHYGFYAEAHDAHCMVVAEACVDVAVPAAADIVVTLAPVTLRAACSAARCADGVCGEPADLGVPIDLGSRCAPRVSGDTRWAQYPVPGAPGHSRRYEISGTADAATVVDCVTGLEWQRVVAPGTYTHADAVAHCEGLTLAGYTDWRLPSRIELVTLVDYSVAAPGPLLDAVAFPATPQDWFWSASSVAGWSSSAWQVDFRDGSASAYDATSGHRARCVR